MSTTTNNNNSKETKHKSWLPILATIPVSVIITWISLAGTYREKIDSLQETVSKQELAIEAYKADFRKDQVETWREIASIKERLVKLDTVVPRADYRIERIEKKLDGQGEILSLIRSDISSLRTSQRE